MTTSKERLLQTIALLEKQGIGEHDRAFDILDALASGLIWSEESDIEVRALGTKIAQELYDCATQNAEHQEYNDSPDNPRNWFKGNKHRQL